VAGAEKHSRSSERARIIARCVLRSNQSGAETDHGGIAARMAGGVFQSEAAALWEAEQHDAFGSDPLLRNAVDQLTHQSQGLRQSRFVPVQWSEEGIWIPGIPGCLRRD